MIVSGILGSIVGIIYLFFASWNDVKTREVPDWLNFSLLAFAIGNAAIMSLYLSNPKVILDSLMGFVFGLLLGLLMFYTGQWGGGDSKLLIGLSALIGFDLVSVLQGRFNLLLVFMINMLFVGAAYGLLFSFWKFFANFRACKTAIDEKQKKKEAFTARMIIFFIILSSLIYVFLGVVGVVNVRPADSLLALAASLFLLILYYTWMVVTVVEQVCMVKKIKLSELTEGDWIVKPIIKDNKPLFRPSRTGVSMDEINLLRRNSVRRVIIKVGIPFVPSFLIAFALTLLVGNWLAFMF